MSDEANMAAGPGDDEALAAEYALGVLDAEERTRCAERITRDPAFAALVADWEARLSGLNEGFVPAAVPPSVKAAIDRRLHADKAETRQDRAGLWSSLAFWRTLAGAALAGLAVLAVMTLGPQATQQPGERLVAALASDETEERFVAVFDAASRELRVAHVAGNAVPDRDFEVWLIVGDEPPESLGILSSASVPLELEPGFTAGATLAVSLEPAGGSPTGAPTGPVVAAGRISAI